MPKSKWYAQGQSDCADGFCDPPWSKGHRDHERYMEGWRDQDAEERRITEERDLSEHRLRINRGWDIYDWE